MEHKQPTPSVLARLMGFDELPPSHLVQKRQRVLSENYLQRVASIGVREKLVGRRSFGLNIDEQNECIGAFQFIGMSKRGKHNASSVRKRRVKCSSDAVISAKTVEAKPVSVEKNGARSKVDVDSRLLTSIMTTEIVLLKPSIGELDSAATFFASSAGSHKASHSEVKKHGGVLSRETSNNLFEADKSKNQENGIGSFRSRSRFSKDKRRKMGSISAELLQSKVAREKISAEDPASRISSSQNLTNIKNKSFCSDVPVTTTDGKKQILERWRTAKKNQQVEISSTKKIRQEVLAIGDEPNVNPLGTNSSDCFQYEQVILKKEDTRENKGSNENLLEQVSSISNGTVPTAQISPLKGTLLNHEEQWVPAIDDHPVLSLNISVQQDKANTGFVEEPVTPQYSDMDPESPMSLEEIYQPSPNSVLGPFYREEMIANPECFKSVSDSLLGLQMQLELLKSETSETYSEGSSMIVSSDDDIAEGSVGDPEENEVIVRSFEVEESRDFSYLVDVLSEADFRSNNLQICPETWHSSEGPISFSIFESLEKKYGEQISWKRSDRRLLFDRINLGLMEILLPAMSVPEWKKTVAGRFSSENGQVLIEEELWAMLGSQEKEKLKDSKQILVEEEKLSDLTEDSRDIGREIENSLIDELVVDLVSM